MAIKREYISKAIWVELREDGMFEYTCMKTGEVLKVAKKLFASKYVLKNGVEKWSVNNCQSKIGGVRVVKEYFVENTWKALQDS